jgi:uroporphyrinogen-III synthase
MTIPEPSRSNRTLDSVNTHAHDQPLFDRTIAVPETRQLDVLANLLTKRGARVLRCPLVSICDSPDVTSVTSWLERFINDPPALFILLTGEGLTRLLGFVESCGLPRSEFVNALQKTIIVARGPKPGRALRSLKLSVDHQAKIPTTTGIIELLSAMTWPDGRVCVQLYGDDPNKPLMDYLERRGVPVDAVAPYRYADNASTDKVVEFIRQIVDGSVDAVVFTSKAQVNRFFAVAKNTNMADLLPEIMSRIAVASVGPVVVDELRQHGVQSDVMPDEQFFMKPLVTALCRALSHE